MQIRPTYISILAGLVLALWIQPGSAAQLLTDPDINDDGVVNFVDIGLFAECFATDVTTSPECTNRDFDGSGFVNFLDLTVIKDNFLVSFPTAQEAQLMFAGLRHKVTPTLQFIDVADINLDGYPDIVGTRRTDNLGSIEVDVTLLLGSPEGNYTETQTPLLTSVQAGGIEVRHLNDDIYPDIVVLSQNPSAFTVLINDGEGEFLQAVDYPIDGLPIEMSVSDVTGDGVYDVVVIDSSNVSIFPGLTGGTFGQVELTELVSSPDTLAVFDVNGDSFNDVIVLVGFPNEILVLYNDGSGLFDVSEIVATSIVPETVNVSDVNNDGNADLIVASRFSRTAVEILYGSSQGDFTAIPRIVIEYQPLTVDIGDLNSDGFDDIVVLHRFNSAATVILSIDGVSFEEPKVFALPSTPLACAVADLDGDQIDDIVAYGSVNSHLWLSLSSGDSIFNQPFSIGNGVSPGKLISGDFNSDGNEDIVAASLDFPANTLSLFPGDGSGALGAASSVLVLNQVSDIEAGDFNNDGALDIIAGSDVNTGLSLLLGAGDGTFQLFPPTADTYNVLSMDTLDIDGDGNLDVLVESSSDTLYALGNGDGTFDLLVSFGISDFDLTLADLNDDGISDLVSINPASLNVRVRLGLGTGVFAAPVELAENYSANEIVVADLNSDGVADLIIPFSEGFSRGLSIRLGLGNGGFAEELRYDNVIALNPQVVDVNQDGKKDIVAFTAAEVFGNGFSVFLGNGDGGLQPPASFNTRPLPKGIIVGDFDADDAPDVVTSSILEKVIEVNINRGSATN